MYADNTASLASVTASRRRGVVPRPSMGEALHAMLRPRSSLDDLELSTPDSEAADPPLKMSTHVTLPTSAISQPEYVQWRDELVETGAGTGVFLPDQVF